MGSPASPSSSAEYIRKVHHLIEECMVFKMSKEECMKVLSKHANIKPVITATVWQELEKENKEFFENYSKKNNGKKTRDGDKKGKQDATTSQSSP